MSEPKIYFIDLSYDNHVGLSENEASELEKKQIESEFDIHVEPANIGAGADLPAFLVTLNNYTLIAGAVFIFFQGKSIKENLDAWIEIGKTIAKFLKRPVLVNREAAVLIALNAYSERTGAIPTRIQLLGYRAFNRRFSQTVSLETKEISGCDPDPNEENLSDTIHFLQLMVDDTMYRFVLDGKNIKMEQLKK